MIKRYVDYTNEELIKANEDTIEALIQLEYAHNGVFPVDDPGELEIDSTVADDVTVEAFQVCGKYFLTMEDARRMQEALITAHEYSYSYCVDGKYLIEPLTEYNRRIEVTKALLTDKATMKASILEIKKVKEVHTQAINAYEKYFSETVNCREAVLDAVNRAKSGAAEIDFAVSEFQRYVLLADGDEVIASKFFYDAWSKKYESQKAIKVLQEIVKRLELGQLKFDFPDIEESDE